MAKSMFAALNKANKERAGVSAPTNLASAVTQMRCPGCGEQPKPSIRVNNDIVHCPHCQQAMFVLPPSGENFAERYKEWTAQEPVILKVAEWFPCKNVIAAGMFLGWLGQRLVMEQA